MPSEGWAPVASRSPGGFLCSLRGYCNVTEDPGLLFRPLGRLLASCHQKRFNKRTRPFWVAFRRAKRRLAAAVGSTDLCEACVSGVATFSALERATQSRRVVSLGAIDLVDGASQIVS